jgi:hypothetical protein
MEHSPATRYTGAQQSAARLVRAFVTQRVSLP